MVHLVHKPVDALFQSVPSDALVLFTVFRSIAHLLCQLVGRHVKPASTASPMTNSRTPFRNSVWVPRTMTSLDWLMCSVRPAVLDGVFGAAVRAAAAAATLIALTLRHTC